MISKYHVIVFSVLFLYVSLINLITQLDFSVFKFSIFTAISFIVTVIIFKITVIKNKEFK